jgi:hypothetical protein
MAVNYAPEHIPTAKSTRRSSLEFRFIFCICFSVFLGAAIVERLMPWNWMRHSSRRRSVFEQAKEAAGTCTAYAFMG